jgi:hypothetical protein
MVISSRDGQYSTAFPGVPNGMPLSGAPGPSQQSTATLFGASA